MDSVPGTAKKIKKVNRSFYFKYITFKLDIVYRVFCCYVLTSYVIKEGHSYV